MIYLDNGATTWPKPRGVLNEMNKCMKSYCANPGRSGHKMSLFASEKVFDCRNCICELFGLNDPENVIFTNNATSALNLAIKGVCNTGGHAIVTSMEHNSVLRPIHSLGIEYDIVSADISGYVSPDDVKKTIRSNTCLIVCTLASNVCGSVQPYKEIAKLCRDKNILFLLDASQGAGIVDINMQKSGIDMLAAPGHKGLYGPTGTGFLCINTSKLPDPLMFGGTGSRSKELVQPLELPDRFESGTLNVVGIAGLCEGIKFVSNIGLKQIMQKENKLAKIFAEDLASIPKVTLKGYDNTRERVGVVSAVIDGMDCTEVAQILDEKYSICVRAGFHCAYQAHKTIGTGDTGTIRFSLGAFNTLADVKKTAMAMSRIAKSMS